MTVNLGDKKVINFIRLNPNNFGTKTQVKIENIETSIDGKRFIKNQELRDSFVQTEAYSELFMELASDAELAAVFVNGIIPN
jgi:hypothetical protein